MLAGAAPLQAIQEIVDQKGTIYWYLSVLDIIFGSEKLTAHLIAVSMRMSTDLVSSLRLYSYRTMKQLSISLYCTTSFEQYIDDNISAINGSNAATSIDNQGVWISWNRRYQYDINSL